MKRLFCLLFVSLFLSGCLEVPQSEYAKVHAFLRLSPVSAVPPLFQALNSPGLFCTISREPSHYLIRSADGKEVALSVTALEAYNRPEMIAGFIVGTSDTPDLNGTLLPVAYDLVCPNCYTKEDIERKLVFQDRLTMHCPRCNRSYSLRNGGIVVAGEAGIKLFKYRIQGYSRANDVLIINN